MEGGGKMAARDEIHSHSEENPKRRRSEFGTRKEGRSELVEGLAGSPKFGAGVGAGTQTKQSSVGWRQQTRHGAGPALPREDALEVKLLSHFP